MKIYSYTNLIVKTLLLSLWFTLTVPSLSAQRTDLRATRLRDANHYDIRLKKVQNLEEWESRKAQIRSKLLLSAGLHPEPPRTPLNARIFGEVEAEGFKVAKVYFESLPGFLATGNLYVPLGIPGPYPAVLMPHGHWQFGRLQNGPTGSITARCIDLARQGFVVFSIDMVGYNDSFQLPHDGNKSRAQLKADVPLPYEAREFRADFDFARARLYGLSLAGLQLWNGIRALDLLTSLSYVDPERIGVTGASGGATQTILLMAADERVKAAAPVNIIGVEKHPGCRCENIPGLWIDTSTLELAATFAPRPLILGSATEDPWTHSTPQRELPMIRAYYEFYGAESNLSNIHVAAGHNYNAETREAVYAWFHQHLNPQGQLIRDPEGVSREVGDLGDLRVFPDRILPENVLNGRQVIENWIKGSEDSLNDRLPPDTAALKAFSISAKHELGQLLSVELPDPDELDYSRQVEEERDGFVYQVEKVGSQSRGDWFDLESVRMGDDAKGLVVITLADEAGPLLDQRSNFPQSWIKTLVEQGLVVYRPRGFVSGQHTIPAETYSSFSWSESYNRDNRLNAIQDIITTLTSAKDAYPDAPLTVIGLGRSGILTAFAAAVFSAADRVVIDLNGIDPGYDGDLLAALPVQSIRRSGDLRSASLVLMQKKLTVFNTAATFDADWYLNRARGLGLERNLKILPQERRFSITMLP
jgi:dienelactone hydrolase